MNSATSDLQAPSNKAKQMAVNAQQCNTQSNLAVGLPLTNCAIAAHVHSVECVLIVCELAVEQQAIIHLHKLLERACIVSLGSYNVPQIQAQQHSSQHTTHREAMNDLCSPISSQSHKHAKRMTHDLQVLLAVDDPVLVLVCGSSKTTVVRLVSDIHPLTLCSVFEANRQSKWVSMAAHTIEVPKVASPPPTTHRTSPSLCLAPHQAASAVCEREVVCKQLGANVAHSHTCS